MTDSPTNFLDIANFSAYQSSLPPSKLAQKMVATTEAQKAKMADDALLAKQLALAPADTLKMLATASIQGNDLANNQAVQDADHLSYFELVGKYGRETADSLQRYTDTKLGIWDQKTEKRSKGQVVQDTGVDVTGAITSIPGQIAAAISSVADGPAFKLVNPLSLYAPPISPTVSKASGVVDSWVSSLHSDKWKRQAEQHAIEGELLKQDTQNQYEKDLAAAGGDWGKSVGAWFNKQGKSVDDVFTNYADDPMMLGSAAANAGGSLLAFSTMAGALGKVDALKSLVAGGMSEEAALAHLATPVGKKLIQQFAVKAIPALNGLVEAGSGVTQVQQDILSKSEDDLKGTPLYDSLRAKNMTHEQARDILAARAAPYASAIAGTVGAISGKLVAPIEAAPLKVISKGSFGSAIASATGSTALETADEALQGGAEQLGSNVGERFGAQMPVALDKDVATQATEGGLAGLLSTGGMQAPGAALGTIRESARAAKAMMEDRFKRVSREITQEGPVGDAAHQEAVQSMRDGADAVIQSAAGSTASDQATPGQSEANQSGPAPVAMIAATVDKSTYVNADEAAHYTATNGHVKSVVEANPDQKLDRATVIKGLGQTVLDNQAAPLDRVQSALLVLSQLDTMRQVSSDANRDAVKALPEDNPIRGDIRKVLDSASLLESTPGVQAAQKIVASLKPEQVEALLAPSLEAAAQGDAATKADAAQMLEVVARVNPAAIKPAMFEKLRNKIDPSTVSEQTQTSLNVSAKLAAEAAANEEAKAKLSEEAAAQVGALTDAERKQEQKQAEINARMQKVSDEVYLNGHGPLPSLMEHRRLIGDAVAAGRLEAGKEYLRAQLRFGISMLNKIKAINQSAENGGNGVNVPYWAYDKTGERFEVKKGAGVKVSSPNSRAFARAAWLDAHMVVAQTNAMMDAYGESLGLTENQRKKLTLPELHSAITAAGQTAPNQSEAPPAPTSPSQDAEAQGGSEPQAKPAADAAADGTDDSKPKVNVWHGTGENAELSNLAERPFEFKDRQYRSVEHAYQSLKSGEFDARTSNLYKTSKPGSKIPGRLGTKTEGGWNKALMYALMKASFEQNPEAADALLATGDAEITHSQDKGYWGEHFPQILTQIRDELQVSQDSNEEDTPPAAEPTAEDLRIAQEQADEAAANDRKTSNAKGFAALKAVLLVPMGQLNRFLAAFKPGKNGSTFLTREDPVAYLLDHIEELAGLNGNGITRQFTVKEMRSLQAVLKHSMPAWTQSFRDMFDKSFAGDKAVAALAKEDGTYSWLRDGTKPVLSYNKYLPANFLVESPEDDGSLELSEHVLQATMLAALQWLLVNGNRERENLNDEKIAKKLGLPRDTRPTNSMRKAAQAGPLSNAVFHDIARTIQDLLGVEPDPEATESYTQGLFTAMASNAVRVLEKDGVLKVDLHKARYYDKTGNAMQVKTVLSVNPQVYEDAGKTPAALKMLETFRSMPDLFTRIFLPDGEKTRYIGKPPRKVSQSLIRQGFSRISPKQDRVIHRLQQVKWRMNDSLYRATEQFTGDFLAQMLGYVEVNEDNKDRFNQSDLLSIEGKNNSIRYALSGVEGYVREIEEEAKAEGKDRSEVDVFFDYKFSSVGRLQQQGPITPQGDKIMRELITATNAVLDLNDEEQSNNLWLAIAQNLGIKIERQSHEDSIRDAKQALRGKDAKLGPIVELLKEGKPFTKEDMDIVRGAVADFGKPFTMKMLHAIHVAARIGMADAEGRKQFKTSLSLEADGVTDGPVNAMVHMKTGKIDEAYIANLARGGWFFTDKAKTIQDQKRFDKVDIYKQAAKVFETKLAGYLKILSGENANYALSLLRVMHTFLPGEFVLKDPQIKDLADLAFEADRNLIKNPLTVFIYGSSIDGISGKLLSSVEKKLYQVMTEIAQSGKGWAEHPLFVANPMLAEDLHRLFNTAFTKDKTRNLFPQAMLKTGADFLTKPVEADIPSQVAAEMISGISKFFAEPMTEAINQVTGHLSENMRLTQQASQIQTAIFQQLFEDRMRVRQAEMVKEGKLFGSQLLPQAELLKIFRELMKVSPVYDTEDMEFHISGKEGFETSREVSTNLEGKYPTGANLMAPSDASVKVSPYLTIGTGDGQMVLNIYADGSVKLDQTLPVFDGIEIGIDNIKGASGEINAGVFKGWMMSNPFQSVADGFAHMLRHVDFSDLNDETLKEISRILELDGEEPVDPSHLSDMASKLSAKALNAEARKAAMARLNSYVDHMGGAGMPHHNAGEAVGNDDFAAVAKKLDDLMAQELQRLKAEAKAEKDLKPASRQKVKGLLGKIGHAVKDTHGVVFPGVIGFYAPAMAELISEKMGASKDQVALVQEILKTEGIDNFQFFQGTAKELNRLKAEFYPQLDSEPIQDGQTAIFNEVVFLTKADPETALHELIHAWVGKAIQAYYADPENAKEHIRDTIKRLEALRDQVLALDPETYDEATQKALAVLRSETTNPEHGAAEQMDEFLAWTLSNQKLIAAVSQEKIHHNVLAQVANKVVRLLARLLGISTQPGKTVFSNMVWNAKVLSTWRSDSLPGLEEAQTEAVLNRINPDDARLGQIEHAFQTRLSAYLHANAPAQDDIRGQKTYTREIAARRLLTSKAANRLSQNGYAMNAREQAAFKAIHATMMSGLVLDATAHTRMAEVYQLVLDKLTPEAFLKAWGLEPAQANQGDWMDARLKAGVFQGKAGVTVTPDGRSDILASFFALAQVDEDLRKVLQDIPMPKAATLKVGNTDEAVRMISNALNETLIDQSLKQGKQPRNVRDQLDVLADVLSEVKSENRAAAALQQGVDLINKAEDFAAGKLRQGVNKAVDHLHAKAQQSASPHAKNAYGAAELVMSLFSKDRSQETAKWATELLNQSNGLHGMRALLRDMIGTTMDSKELHQILRKVKALVDAMRQDFREQVPKELAKAFSRKLTRTEWSNMHQGIGRTDLLTFGRERARELIADESARVFEEAELEAKLKKLGGKNARLYSDKIKALATYMAKREVISNNLALNAHALAWLHGEAGYGRLQVTDELIEVIDRLTSLKAYAMLEPAVKDSLAALVRDETQGMILVIGYHGTNREMEIQRLDETAESSRNQRVARNNGLKGYVPSVTDSGHKIIIADVSNHNDLVLQGWTKLDDYHGDANDGYFGKRAYYISDVAGRNAFRQGAAQTVHSTWNGVDVRTGLTHNDDIGGAILGTDAKIIRNERDSWGIEHNLKPGEHLIPVFNEHGGIMGFQMPVKPEMTARLQKDTNLARMLGIWSGRIIEERMSNDMNRNLVEAMKKVWDSQSGKSSSRVEFVNVADPRHPDPVIRDAWRTMGWKIKEDAKEIFGEKNVFMVRKDMLDDALGYRAAGVSDAWTGISRFSPETLKVLRESSISVLGKDAYRWLRKGENGAQELVSHVKANIIVRSVRMAYRNELSNKLFLVMAHGMNPVTVAKASRDKYVEIRAYVKNREEILRLQVKLAATANDSEKFREYNTRIKVLEDVNANLSIASIIEAGEFGAISESLTQADIELREGRMVQYIEKLVDKLPQQGANLAKNLIATKESELFKVLNRSVQYGDFVAKAVLYDHLTQKKGMSKEEALDVIAEEFIDYARLPGRVRDSLESIGLLWFFNYTLRSTKIALKTARDRPLVFLLWVTGFLPTFGIGTIFGSSLPGVIADGKLLDKFGPQMGIDGLFVHPWNAMFN